MGSGYPVTGCCNRSANHNRQLFAYTTLLQTQRSLHHCHGYAEMFFISRISNPQSSLSMTSSVSAPSEVLSDTCMACYCQIYNCMFHVMLGPPVLPYAGTTCSTLCWDHLFYLMLGPPVKVLSCNTYACTLSHNTQVPCSTCAQRITTHKFVIVCQVHSPTL